MGSKLFNKNKYLAIALTSMLGFAALSTNLRTPWDYLPNPSRSTAFFSSSAVRRTQRM